jgi:gliding motility-associated-like protein
MVTIKSDSNCIVTDPITIDVSCGDVFVPKAFSPNGDGQNDLLYARGACIATIEFVVFDRWGNKLFETTDKNTPWDGTSKGQPVNTGTYVYMLNATLNDGTSIHRKGNIELIS